MKNKKYLKVIGNRPINGVIKASGSKNAALPIIAASLMCDSQVVLDNVPDIIDVRNMLGILSYLNVEYEFKDNRLTINPLTLKKKHLTIDLMNKLRASYYLIPVLLEENDILKFSNVGGCNFENRPIDIHLNLLKKVGCNVIQEESNYKIKLQEFKKLTYNFERKTFGGTINAILLGLKTKKDTSIKNCCPDPEIIDFISFLKKAGLDINYNDNNISFSLKTPLKGIQYTIMDDRIEAETLALIGLSLGRIGIFDFSKEHHQGFISFLDNNDIVYSLEDNFLVLNKELVTKGNDIELDFYPCLSTDIGPILFSYLLLGSKMFLIKDNIYKTRLSKLRFFQSSFCFQNDIIFVNPNKINKNNDVFYGSNLRDTMAYLFYALTHDGTFYIYGIEHIERGYEKIIDKLISLNCIVEEINET